jgi:hypothetical protein
MIEFIFWLGLFAWCIGCYYFARWNWRSGDKTYMPFVTLLAGAVIALAAIEIRP